MLLKAHLFEQICGELRTLRNNTRSERRGRPRAGMRVLVTMIPCVGDDPQPRQVWVRDLSREGIGFVSNEPFDAGTQVLITLPRGAGPALEVLYITTRCDRLEELQYSIGARLDRIIPSADAI
jgi:hypothetical protein